VYKLKGLSRAHTSHGTHTNLDVWPWPSRI